MKRASLFLGPPLAFTLAALAGWAAAPREGEAVPADGISFRSKLPRPVTTTGPALPAMIAARFENNMLSHSPVEVHDAAGMETLLMRSRLGSFPHGFTAVVEYASDWAEESPAEMFQWLIHDGGSDFSMRVTEASLLFEKWAEKDMETALAAVFKIPNMELRRQAFASTTEVLCKSDPGRARELLMRNLNLFPPGLKRSPFNLYDTRRTICDLFLSLPPSEERTHLLSGLMAEMRYGKEDVAHVVSVWKNASEQERRAWVGAGFTTDADNAASFDGLEDFSREHAELSADPKTADEFMKIHGPQWAERDLAGALDWSQIHLKGWNRINTGGGLFKPVASRNPDQALRVWQTLPEGALKDLAAKAISDGAPDERKAEVDALLEPFSGTD